MQPSMQAHEPAHFPAEPVGRIHLPTATRRDRHNIPMLYPAAAPLPIGSHLSEAQAVPVDHANVRQNRLK